MIKQLKSFPHAPVSLPATPRCESDVTVQNEHERNWRARRYPGERVFQCIRPSVVEIQGRNYCRLHGGHRVLQMYIDGQLVEKK